MKDQTKTLVSLRGFWAGCAVWTGLAAILLPIAGLAELLESDRQISFGISLALSAGFILLSAILTGKAVDAY